MITLQGGCRCGAVRYAIALDDVPGARLRATYCHCADCRLTIGGFCGLYAELPRQALALTTDPSDALVHYNASAAYKRSHCGKCGTSVCSGADTDTPSIVVTTLDDDALQKYVDVKGHIYVGSAPGGGIASIIDDGLPRWVKGSRAPEGTWTPSPQEHELERQVMDIENGIALWGEELKGGCHCKGIQFVIRRPPEDYLQDPTLRNWTKLGLRLAAIHCFCDTCRAVSGAPFWTWVFVPRKQLTFTENATERIYHSHATKPIERRFCGRCGCSFSYAVRDDMWDISVATLEQPRAEGWLAFQPTAEGRDQADAALGSYIHGWLSDAPTEERPLSYAGDGEKYNPRLVEAVRRGRTTCTRL